MCFKIIVLILGTGQSLEKGTPEADPGEGLRGLQPLPLRSFSLLFCLILRKIIIE